MSTVLRRSLTAMIVVLATMSAATPAVAAADTTPPKLRSIALSRDAITVAGYDVQLLTVNVRLTDDVGVVPTDDGLGVRDPYLLFAGRETLTQRVNLDLGTGTPADGVWTGVVAVTSAWRGAEQPARVVASDGAGNRLSVDPRTVIETPVVTVTSSHRPVLTLTVTPDPVFPNGAVTQTVRAHDETTGAVWPSLPITIGYDDQCGTDAIAGPTARTDGTGRYQGTLPAGQTYDQAMCAWVPAANVPGQPFTRVTATGLLVRYKYVVTARPARTSVPAGTNVAVTGRLAPAQQGKTLHLQRRYGTEWRTVNAGQTTATSTFTLTATPPGVGTWSYRVFAPTEEHRAGNTSVTFTIRGT